MKFIDKRTCWLLTTSSHTIARRGACTTHTHTKQKGHGLTQKGHKQCACLFGCGATQLNNKGREEKGKRKGRQVRRTVTRGNKKETRTRKEKKKKGKKETRKESAERQGVG